MPYRTPLVARVDDAVTVPEVAKHVSSRHRAARRHVTRVTATLLGGLSLAVTLAVGIDVATRPTLGPDVDVPVVERAPLVLLSRGCPLGAAIPDERDEERRYDVDGALRPPPGLPFGADPTSDDDDPARARRRTAPIADVDAFIPGTTTLVSWRPRP